MTREAETFWQGRCPDCAHPEHEMTCHELIPNGDPSNGPAYCPCAVRIEGMEQEIVRLRAAAAERPSVDTLRAAFGIRATHPYGFRVGEWADVIGIEYVNDRACFRVRFIDGAEDSWVVYDASDPYEFRAAAASSSAAPPVDPEWLRRIADMTIELWSVEDDDALRRGIRKINGLAISAINEHRLAAFERPPVDPEDPQTYDDRDDLRAAFLRGVEYGKSVVALASPAAPPELHPPKSWTRPAFGPKRG